MVKNIDLKTALEVLERYEVIQPQVVEKVCLSRLIKLLLQHSTQVMVDVKNCRELARIHNLAKQITDDESASVSLKNKLQTL